MGRPKDLPEEKEIYASFRKQRERLEKQIKAYAELDIELDEVQPAIQHAWSTIARLEEELDKLPTDEDLELELEEFVETDYSDNRAYTKIPETTYNKLLNRLKRLEAKVSRVEILDKLGRHSRMLTQHLTSKAKIEESQMNTKRIGLEVHHASLMQLTKIFYLALRQQNFTDDEIASVAKRLKRIQKDYPLIETDFNDMKRLLFAEPEDIPKMITDAEYEEVNDMEDVNDLVRGKAKRGKK